MTPIAESPWVHRGSLWIDQRGATDDGVNSMEMRVGRVDGENRGRASVRLLHGPKAPKVAEGAPKKKKKFRILFET